MTSGGDALIEFRTAYLRAVSLVWRQGTADEAVQNLLDPTQNALTVMNDLFGCDVPWNMWVRLSWDPDESKRPQWRPRLGGGWVGGERHHRITVYVPSHECLPSNAVHATALAAHYAVSPTLFGEKPTGEDASFDVRLGSITTFEEFGGVFLRMLGLLWRVPTEPALAGLPAGLFGPNPEVMFQRWFAYRWPYNIDLEFVKCTPGVQFDENGKPMPYCMQWTPSHGSTGQGGGWEFAEVDEFGTRGAWKLGLPQNELELSIPHFPVQEQNRAVRDLDIEPLALAAYNQTGEVYPLTCCGC
jgi:hypothetical protein